MSLLSLVKRKKELFFFLQQQGSWLRNSEKKATLKLLLWKMNAETGNLHPQEIICEDKNAERVWVIEMKHKMMMRALITPWGNESL